MVALLFKAHNRLFSNRTTENETEQQKGDAPVIYYKRAVALLFTLVTFGDSPRVTYPQCSKVGRRQPLSSFVFNDHFFFYECPEHNVHFGDLCKVNKGNALYVM